MDTPFFEGKGGEAAKYLRTLQAKIACIREEAGDIRRFSINANKNDSEMIIKWIEDVEREIGQLGGNFILVIRQPEWENDSDTRFHIYELRAQLMEIELCLRESKRRAEL